MNAVTLEGQIRNRGWMDIRIPFAALLSVYVFLGLGWLGFSRSIWQVTLTLGCALIFDLFGNRLFRSKTWVFPWSGLITGLGLCLLLNFGAHPWLPVLPAFLAIASKHLFTVHGKHVYNPGLFGLIVGMILAGGMLSPAPAYQWGGTVTACFVLGGAALFIFARKINRGPLVLSFLLFYSLQMLLRTWVMRHHLPPETIILGTISSPPFYLFVFYMLTDPATTPRSRKGQIALALAVTLIDMGLHLLRSYSTLFPALFIVQTAVLFYGWVRCAVRGKWPKWKTFSARFAVILATASLFFWSQRTVKVDADFVLTQHKPAAMQAEMSRVMEQVDPRLRHIAKWMFSVGDAVAVADIDGDGLQDLFLTYPLKRAQDRCLMLRNTGAGFERIKIDDLDDVRNHPEKAGLGACAVFADYDNDGDQDLFIGMGYGASRLLRNDWNTDQKFTDVTEKAGLRGHTICLTAMFFDYDRDGDLDLMVGNAMNPLLADYTEETPLTPFKLPEPEHKGDRRMFHFMHESWHQSENGGLNHFYSNRGDGTFEKMNVAKLGMPETHWTLALASADFNDDGWPDIYAASDFGPDDVYLNLAGEGFRRIQGRMFGSVGKDTYKGMNASIADFDRDGYPDVYVSNVHAPLQAEGSLLWMTRPTGKNGADFSNQAVKRSALNEKRFGWGAASGDLDLDGWPDIVQANGMVDDSADKKFETPQDYWYANGRLMRTGANIHSYADQWGDLRGYSIFGHQRNRVYLNRNGSFVDAAETVGLSEKGNSRGVALADMDNDGDLDVIITHQFKSASYYETVLESSPAWIKIKLLGDGKHVTMDAVGAKVVVNYGDHQQTKWVQNTTGFSGQGERNLVIGLGDYTGKVSVQVKWLDGTVSDFNDLETRKSHQLEYR